MTDRLVRRVLCAALLALVVMSAVPASGQNVEDQLSAYTGINAEGYMQPLADAFGAALNDAFFYSAAIPRQSLKITVEFPIMGVIFSDDDRFFAATTEGGFLPQTTTDAPTIVGPGEATTITPGGGASYSFPGGFDLNSFALVVPQLRVSGVMGTEAVVRWFGFDPDTDTEFGDISLFGFGLRHSISQYLSDEFPVDLAAGFMWQSFSVGEDDLISTDAFSVGAQASKAFGAGFITLEPFAGLAFDTFSMNVKYESDVTSDNVDLDFGTDNTVHLTLGLGLRLPVAHIHGAFNVASQNSFNFGIALGNVGF